MFDIQGLKERLQELGARPNKKLGQNFLINLDISDRIVTEAMKYDHPTVVEVGPGVGALTEFILKAEKKLTLIELDQTFADFWEQRGLKVIRADALALDWSTLNLENAILVSNLPYQISSSLLIDRSVLPSGIERMVLMFQKEVGQRITGKQNTEDYGLLSVIAQTFWDCEKLFDVGPKDFYPPPKVASRVLKFKRIKNSGLTENQSKSFLKFVKSAFAQRRKFLIKNLTAIAKAELLQSAFAEMSINPKARAEDLSPKQFVELYKKVFP